MLFISPSIEQSEQAHLGNGCTVTNIRLPFPTTFGTSGCALARGASLLAGTFGK